MPDHGHPSSLWGRPIYVPTDPHRPYVLPEDFGITGDLAQEILDWTSYFQRNFDTTDLEGRYVRSTNENRALAGLPRLEVPRSAITPTNPPAPDDEGVVVLDMWDGS